jgi:hypothetical protein
MSEEQGSAKGPMEESALPAAAEPVAAKTEPAAAETAPKPAVKPMAAPKPKPPAPRELPTEEGIARWIEGADYPVLAALFNQLILKRYDGLFAQIKKEELLPQHWQVITTHAVPEGVRFEDFHAVGRLRAQYGNKELVARRLGALELAWQELRGKNPSLWSAADLFSAIRRILEKGVEIDYHDLLSAVRDVWRGMTLPQGREQLEVLWACLDFVRSKTRK